MRATKQRYRERVESYFQLNDSRRMWQELRTINAFGGRHTVAVSADSSLAKLIEHLLCVPRKALKQETSGTCVANYEGF